jgi:hypothetical protein
MRVMVAADDAAQQHMPWPLRENHGFWLHRTAALFDVHALAQRARALHGKIAPSVVAPAGSPETLSYFLAASSALPAEDQHVLFCTPNTAVRLQMVRRVPLCCVHMHCVHSLETRSTF